MIKKETDKKKLCIGKIVAPHGIRGLVKLDVYSDTPEEISSYKISNKEGSIEFKITLNSKQKNLFIASIDGINDRNQSETLKNTLLYIERGALPELEEENFYINDLIGLTVITDKKQKIGKVIDCYNFGAGDILEIELLATKKTKCFSFTKAIFPEINMDENYITLCSDQLS